MNSRFLSPKQPCNLGGLSDFKSSWKSKVKALKWKGRILFNENIHEILQKGWL